MSVGYTKRGLKSCLHPLLAVLAEVRLVAQLWLRPGNTSCGGNVTAFFLDLWENLPSHIRLRGVRADSGFCFGVRLPYGVVAQSSQPIQRLIKGDLPWTATEVPGTEVAELECQADNEPLFVDAFEVIVLFAKQQMLAGEFFLRAIIIIAKQRHSTSASSTGFNHCGECRMLVCRRAETAGHLHLRCNPWLSFR